MKANWFYVIMYNEADGTRTLTIRVSNVYI